MEPQRALRNSLWSPKKYPANSGTQEIRIFYLHEFLNSKCFILFVSRWPISYLVMEQGGSEDTENNN